MKPIDEIDIATIRAEANQYEYNWEELVDMVSEDVAVIIREKGTGQALLQSV